MVINQTCISVSISVLHRFGEIEFRARGRGAEIADRENAHAWSEVGKQGDLGIFPPSKKRELMTLEVVGGKFDGMAVYRADQPTINDLWIYKCDTAFHGWRQIGRATRALCSDVVTDGP